MIDINSNIILNWNLINRHNDILVRRMNKPQEEDGDTDMQSLTVHTHSPVNRMLYTLSSESHAIHTLQ